MSLTNYGGGEGIRYAYLDFDIDGDRSDEDRFQSIGDLVWDSHAGKLRVNLYSRVDTMEIVSIWNIRVGTAAERKRIYIEDDLEENNG
jgi:hypothetical protein